MAKRPDRSPAKTLRIKCAAYCRKSTEEGLEQSFNSLDAQREACAAYVMSQCHEGWELVPTLYDDGGFSGGTMERPALKHLLADVAAGKVDVIVVYKVDRLTRSLADFAKIVEILDARGASFCSITQAFNTTSSMGRLTLNVLLSFAQFEREVTGERIRDKVAASKRKGMWMGGVVPLGYRVENRKLEIDEQEGETVRQIFRRYVELGSVLALKAECEELRITTRIRTSRNGKTYGGVSPGKGALYTLLQNRLYVGEVHHKGTHFPGEHQPIVDRDLFEQAQQRLAANRVAQQLGENASQPSLLAGIVSDAHGRPMSPSHSCRGTKRYRYYVSRTVDAADAHQPIFRVAASELEELIIAQLIRWLRRSGHGDANKITAATPSEQRAIVLRHIRGITIGESAIEIALAEDGEPWTIPAKIVRVGQQVRIAVPPSEGRPVRHDPALIKLIGKAWQARQALVTTSAETSEDAATELAITRNYLSRLIRLSYLPPDILTSILEGKQPASLTRQKLARIAHLPLEWDRQRETLGFG